eukprot:7949945-Pyramimonas_sp.AAC.1
MPASQASGPNPPGTALALRLLAIEDLGGERERRRRMRRRGGRLLGTGLKPERLLVQPKSEASESDSKPQSEARREAAP